MVPSRCEQGVRFEINGRLPAGLAASLMIRSRANK